jgi:hypothetical protein
LNILCGPNAGEQCERPKKSALKKSVVDRLAQADFARIKQQARSHPDVMEFSHPDPSFEWHLVISFDRGFIERISLSRTDIGKIPGHAGDPGIAEAFEQRKPGSRFVGQILPNDRSNFCAQDFRHKPPWR